MNRRSIYTFTLALLIMGLVSVTAYAAPYIYLPTIATITTEAGTAVPTAESVEVEIFRADATNDSEVSFNIPETGRVISVTAGPQRQYIYAISDIIRYDGGTDKDQRATHGWKLTIIDTKDSNKAIASIPFSDEPVDVVVNPRTNKAYVLVMKKDDADKIIDGEINIITNFSVTSKIPVGKNPSAIAMTYDGDIYVTNTDDGTVSVIKNNVEAKNLDNGTAENKTPFITVGKNPGAIVVSDDSRFIYVANLGDNAVSVIRGIDHNDFDDDGDEVTVADENTVGTPITIPNSRTLIDLATMNYKDETGTYKNYIFALTNDGTDNYIYMIDTASNPIAIANDYVPIKIDAPLASTIATSANGSKEDGTLFYLHVTDTIATSYKVDEPTDSTAFTENRSALSVVGTVPDAPTGLIMDDNDTDFIRIEWNDTEGETGYKIERRDKSDDKGYIQIDIVGENKELYEDTNLPDNDDFDYRIRAFNEGANSFYSEALSTSTDEDDPSTCFIDSSSKTKGYGIMALLMMLAALPVAGKLSSRICLAFQKR